MADLARRGLIVAAGAALVSARPALAQDKTAAQKTAWDFSFPALEGGTLNLADFRGRVLLVVNTASFCGFTYQYEGLQKLYAARKDQGFVVVGVPSRDFDQEAASNEQVKTFCEATFGIDFPMAAISHVTGEQAHPFYRWVRAERHWEPRWNFGKVLIGRDGRVMSAFGSSDEPMGFRVSSAVETALNNKA